MTNEDTEHTAEIDGVPELSTGRRRFLQAAGIGAAGLTAFGGFTAAQNGGGNLIELEAITIETGGGSGRHEYAWEDGQGGTVRGPPQAVCDAVGGQEVWMGVSPGSIEDVVNPTLELTEGQDYTIEWTNEDGKEHDFVIADDDGNELFSTDSSTSEGETVSDTFEATAAMAQYYCGTHPSSQGGTIDVGPEEPPEPTDEVLDVLYLGGVEDAATHFTEDLLEVLAPYMLERGIKLHYTERQADLNSETLSNYDAVLHYGNRYEGTDDQIDALVDFVENGGGFVPVHSASFSFNSSETYVSLVGGMFDEHPPIQSTTTERLAPEHPVFEGVDVFSADEEPYRHTDVADDITVLEYAAGADYGEDENEPWTWTRTQGDGRVFYTAWGHSAVWETEGFKQLLTNAIWWTTGNEDTIGDTPTVPEKTYTHIEDYGHDAVPHYANFDEPYGLEPPEGLDPDDDGEWELVQDPFDVGDSVDHSITPAEFELEYFVSEDELADEGVEGEIMDMAFDAAGRCWLSVTLDYPNDGGAGNDSIVICEDTDGDGIADDFTVFADGLSIPHSLIPYQNGVIVAEVGVDESGRVVQLEDTNDDDVMDEENVIFTGYGTGDTHAGLNQLYWGQDNWIYGVVGYEGLDPSIDEDLSLDQAVFRFRPDGSEIEFVGSLPSNTAGVKTNEEGLVFASAATAGANVTSYAAIPAAYYDFINEFEGITTVDIRSDTNFSRTDNENRFLPINQRYRQVDRHGGFTAASEQEIYTAREFPEQYWNGTTFVGDGTGQLMSTFYLEQDGPGYVSNYYHNLFASNDEWSSPTYANTGPDGMVWMIDFYNFIFQHNPDDVPGYESGDGSAYVTNVREAGGTYGRLYRVTTGDQVDPHPQDLSDASPSELVGALSDDNMFWRQTAQRKLIEQDATGVEGDLVSMVESEDLDELGLDVGAIHALWTLEGLGLVEANAAAIRGALTHSSAGVRLNALRVLPGTAATRDAIMDNDLLNDEDGRVQMWALLKLAETPESDDAGQAIFELMDDEANLQEDLLVDAASVAGATHADGFMTAYESTYGDPALREGVNVLSNGGFEEVDQPGPDGWGRTTYGGDAVHTYSQSVSNSGSRSVRIDAEEGTDASWNTTVSVEPDTEYTLSGYVMTENVQLVDGTGFSDITPFGAVLNVDQVGGASDGDVVTDPITGTTDGWQAVSVTMNSGDNSEFTVNCLFGGFGEATGTAWYDDVTLEDPDGNNLLATSDFETGTTVPLPLDWTTSAESGTAEFTADEAAAHAGDLSARIDSASGANASYSRTVEVDPNAEYTLVGWIMTDGVDAGDGAGARLSIEELGSAAATDAVTGTQDWTEVSVTVNSGDNEQLTVTASLGGTGESSGTTWFDGVALYDPDAEDTEFSENLLPNPSFEQGEGNDAEGWTMDDFSVEDAEVDEHFRTDEFSTDGEYSVGITEADGADGAWSVPNFGLQQGEEYILSAMVRTENVETVPDANGDEGAGAILFKAIGGFATSDALTGTNDWTELSTQFVQEGPTANIHLMQGLGGNATGTTWFDEVSLVRILTGEENPLADIYERVRTHVETETGPEASFTASSTSVAPGTEVSFDASGSSDPDGSIASYEWDFGDDSTGTGQTASNTYDSAGEYDVTLTVTDDSGNTDTATQTITVEESDLPPGALDPSETIALDGVTTGWEATAPGAISGQENPTLTLAEGEEYTMEWTDSDAASHNLEIRDADGNVVDDADGNPLETATINNQGETLSLTFAATPEMVTYICWVHPTTMVGDIEMAGSSE